MRLVDDGSTSPTLLSEVADWQDHPAWVTFPGPVRSPAAALVPRLRPRR